MALLPYIAGRIDAMLVEHDPAQVAKALGSALERSGVSDKDQIEVCDLAVDELDGDSGRARHFVDAIRSLLEGLGVNAAAIPEILDDLGASMRKRRDA
jgi:hypothetical protein